MVNEIQSSATTSRKYLISNWAFQWRMSFNSDLTKQAQEVIFSRKTKKLLHPCLSFNNIPLKNSISQKHLGLKLDVKLNFVEYMKNIIQKISKKMGAFCRFQPILPRSSLLTIYKTFIRSHLDFADVIHGQAYISLYIIKSRRWFKKICHFYKILTEKSPSYLFNLIHNLNRTHQTRHRNNIPAIYTRHNYFNNSYFPCNISESNKQS